MAQGQQTSPALSISVPTLYTLAPYHFSNSMGDS
jgi:hypothetical protein